MQLWLWLYQGYMTKEIVNETSESIINFGFSYVNQI